ncbi:MAG: hypothetical protein HOP07_10055 [Bacteriovoracaceae bacterium]|nr:hypothetical protein [Bacteriovoracaceae bacterium]
MGNQKTLFNDKNTANEDGDNASIKKDNSGTPKTSAKAKCTCCDEEKLQTRENFYFRKARNRFESVCLECKKQKQRTLRSSSKQIGQSKDKNINRENVLVRATEQSFPSPDKSDKDDVFKVFNLLKQWRDELQQQDPEEFKKIWQEVKDVSKR